MNYLITGGTGSFGHAMVERLLKKPNVSRITVFSRDEDKQEMMRRKYALHYVVGDIRDLEALSRAMSDIDVVFHAAALKQVPACENNPLEAITTNLLGGDNVFLAAERSGVRTVVALSTDKACYPINTMGMTKALMEKLMVAHAQRSQERKSRTVFCATRYGNVAGSRGSVIPFFVECIRQGQSIRITDPTMTRFLLSMDDALDLVLYAFEEAVNGGIYILKAPATTIETLGHAVCELFHAPYEPQLTGVRPGEKMHETLVTQEEMDLVIDNENFYVIPPNVRYWQHMPNTRAFTSDSAVHLTVEQTVEKLKQMKFIQEALGCE
jgi:UDP-N-acetylglucosamine 4,6-dehydratase